MINNFTITIDGNDPFLRRIMDIVKTINEDIAKMNTVMSKEVREDYLKVKIAFHKKKVENAATKGEKTLEEIIIEKLKLELVNLLE